MQCEAALGRAGCIGSTKAYTRSVTQASLSREGGWLRFSPVREPPHRRMGAVTSVARGMKGARASGS